MVEMIRIHQHRITGKSTGTRAGAFASNPMLMDADHFNHKIEWSGGVLEQDCSELIKEFFKGRRSK